MIGKTFLIAAFVALAITAVAVAQSAPASDGGFENEVITSEGVNTFRVRRGWSLNTATRTLVATGLRVRRSNETGVRSIQIDGIRFVATADGRLAFALSYFDRELSATSNTLDSTTTYGLESARAGFAVRFENIVVYQEANSVAGFQEGADTVIASYDLTNLPRVAAPWSFSVDTPAVRTLPDGNTVRSLTIRSTNGVFALRGFVGDHPFRVDGNRVRPDDIKLTFVVNTTRIAAFTQAGYKLAIRAVVVSSTSRTSTDGSDSQEINVGGDAIVKTAFNWAKSVNVTGAGLARVQAAVITEINNQYSNSTTLGGFSGSFTATRLTWSFAPSVDYGGRVLEWDPSANAAINYDVLDASSASSVSFSVLGALVVILASLLFL